MSRSREAPLAGSILGALALLLGPTDSFSAPPCSDHAAWDACGAHSTAIYATVWSASGVAGCRGARFGRAQGVSQEVRSALLDALSESELKGRGAVLRGRISILGSGRAVSPDAPYDPGSMALYLSSGEADAVILPGEARTSGYGWRLARSRLGPKAAGRPVLAGVYSVQQFPLTADELVRWRIQCDP